MISRVAEHVAFLTGPAYDGAGLAAEHLADLRRSGLSDETIRAARVRSVPPAELSRVIGPRLAEKTASALLFPYPATEDFYRAKLFPAVSDGDGHTIRYFQPPGTAPHLYIPPGSEAVRANPAAPILVTEGEKKSLKAAQEGLHCVGLGGLWSWRHDGRAIDDLGALDWFERETLLAPDSDVWTRPDLRQAVFALGRDLEARGARVVVVKLPAGPGGAKMGLDDYLCISSREDLLALPRVGLKHAVFSDTARWWKGWNARKEAGPDVAAIELLARGETVRRLHPAQDVSDGVLWYGLPVGDKLVFVNSSRESCTAEALPAGLALRHAEPGPSSLDRETALAWMSGATGSVAEALDEIEGYLRRHVAFRDARAPLWLSAWTLATWCFRAFPIFPYLWLRSPEKRCGKTRLMKLIGRVAFNSSPVTTHPTEAFLYREAERRSGVQLFDEMETLGRGADQDHMGAFLAVLNVGFEAGGAVSRQEKRGDRFVTIEYEAYCPRVVAGLAKLRDTLEDRSLPVAMVRRRRDEPIARITRETGETAARLRAGCALACLTRIGDLVTAYTAAAPLLHQEGVDDRAVDLWSPLLAVALVADAEEGGDRAARFLRVARDLSDSRDGGDEEGNAARLVAALRRIREGQGERLRPAELLDALRAAGFEGLKGPRGVAALLAPLGIVSRSARRGEGRGRGRSYVLDAELLADLAARFSPAEDQEGPPETEPGTS